MLFLVFISMVLNIGLQNWAVVWITRDIKSALPYKKRKKRKKRSEESERK